LPLDVNARNFNIAFILEKVNDIALHKIVRQVLHVDADFNVFRFLIPSAASVAFGSRSGLGLGRGLLSSNHHP